MLTATDPIISRWRNQPLVSDHIQQLLSCIGQIFDGRSDPAWCPEDQGLEPRELQILKVLRFIIENTELDQQSFRRSTNP